MFPDETRATLAISLLAAYADGSQSGAGRAYLANVAQALGLLAESLQTLEIIALQSRHWPESQQRARGLDAAKVMSLMRGN